MTIDELRATCLERIAAGGEAVILVLPGQARSNNVRLFKTRGPLGEVLCDNGKGIVARFKAKAVLKFIEKQEA